MYYQIQISLYEDFSQLVVNKVVENINEYIVPDNLDHYTVYYWRVKVIDSLTGAESEWSEPCMFRVIAQDVTITTNIDNSNSYIIYGSESFGLRHRFVRSYDAECVIPDAVIGACYHPTSGVAQIGVCYCPGERVTVWDRYVNEYLLTEDNMIILTEDCVPLIL